MARKKTPSLPLYRNIAVSFSALTLLLIGLIVYFSITRATIVITPRIQTFPLTSALSVVREPTAGSTALPGKVFQREVTKKDTFTTSVLKEEDAKASGKVSIVNTTGSAQTLIATTRFLTPEKILFRLEKTVVAPARGKVEGTLVADSAGVSGDVAATKWIIPGLHTELQDKIYGVTEVTMTGGRRSVQRLTASDVDAARATLVKTIEDAIRSEESGEAGPGSAGEVSASDVPVEPIVLLTVDPIASALDGKLGSTAAQFSLSVTVRARGVVVSGKALHEWVTTQLKTTIPDDQRLLPIPLSDIITSVSAFDDVAGTARLLVKAEGKTLVRATSPAFEQSRFIGRTPEEVKTLLRSHGGVSDVRVQLTPFFVQRLPRLPDHIRVEINEQ
ncbi:MAG: hypothetical protein Q7S16_03340 [bacterium]|nr:hypothetical protein [bacterium]